MDPHVGNILTLSNSIIGVSILAMPFCFKQCGIVLAILMLLVSSIITRLTSHYLLKSAIMARRRTFELLAFHAFGTAGKTMVEFGIIGFLMGTCIAYFVIIGDLGPSIIAEIFNIQPTDTLRTSIIISVTLFCVLPLGLLRNVDSLNSVSAATIGFYFCLVLKTVSESTAHLTIENWISKVEIWRPVGILQCLPIFAMALSCQTQLFEIYEIVVNPTLDKMNFIVRIAVNICVAVYVCVGFFGYVAFATQPFTGNILMSFTQSRITDIMKIGFILSVAFSFPLVIFPCRASLHSLLFKQGQNPYDTGGNYITETKFKFLTVLIVGTSMVIGILIPNIEVVLGLVGSTIGTMICLIFPVTCFICISTKNTNERLLAQILLFIGILIMVMGTYANLYAMERNSVDNIKQNVVAPKIEFDEPVKNVIETNEIVQKANDIKGPVPVKNVDQFPVKPNVDEIRLEPPQPVEPLEEKTVQPPIVQKVETTIANKPEEKIQDNVAIANENIEEKKPETKKVEEVNIDAIKKEDKEMQEEKVEKVTKDDLLLTFQKHKQEQELLLKEQKMILKEIREEQEDDKTPVKKMQKVEKVIENEVNDKEKQELLNKLQKHKEEQETLLKEQKEILQEIRKEKEEKQVENEVGRKVADQIIAIAQKAVENLAQKEKEVTQKHETMIINKINNPIALELSKAKNNKTLSLLNKNLTNNMIPLPIVKALKDTKEQETIIKEKEIKEDKENNNVPVEALKLNIEEVKRKPEEINNNLNALNQENLSKVRDKREVNEEKNCDKERDKEVKTESPVIKLLTDVTKSNLLIFNHNMLPNVQTHLDEKNVNLKRK